MSNVEYLPVRTSDGSIVLRVVVLTPFQRLRRFLKSSRPQAEQQALHRRRDDRVQVGGGEHAVVDHRGEAMERGDGDRGDLLQSPATTSPASWPSTISAAAPEGPIRRRPHRRDAVLARPHQLQQRGVLDREADVGAGEAEHPRLEVPVRERGAQLPPSRSKPSSASASSSACLSAKWRRGARVAHAHLPRQLAQRQVAARGERRLGRAPAARRAGCRGDRSGREVKHRKLSSMLPLTSLLSASTLHGMSPGPPPTLPTRPAARSSSPAPTPASASAPPGRSPPRAPASSSPSATRRRARRRRAQIDGETEVRALDLADLASVQGLRRRDRRATSTS